VAGSASGPAVEAAGLQFSYPAKRNVPARPALAGVSFAVEPGEIFGFLGPNGGGKSTLFRILATLVRPDAGSLRVFGADLATRAREIRRVLGVVFQSPSLDLQLTVRENLVHQGHLYGLGGRDLAARIAAGLERFGLAERAGQRALELSGGLRRRAEIAKALLHAPRLLLLDEPSTGLDPGARRDLWDTLAALRGVGVTVLLTTHFMEEGDRCGRLALLSAGTVVAEGTPQGLKGEIGGDVITLTGTAGMTGLDADANAAEALARDLAALHPGLGFQVRDGAVRLEHEGGHELAARLAGSLPGRIGAVTVARPTLEDVFLRRTGHRLYDEASEAAA
jgi:ABC-2 type transport system ATP-binding protein